MEAKDRATPADGILAAPARSTGGRENVSRGKSRRDEENQSRWNDGGRGKSAAHHEGE